jgi:hypothetical protein
MRITLIIAAAIMDRAVTGLWFVSLHDGKRGTRQISQGASLLARQRTLLE